MNSRIRPLLALALLAFLFLVNIYRARTQSITCDEAFTYHLFLSGPTALMFRSYDANHHILHTFLCRITTRWFGLSEFTLRLPSLLSGLLYFVVVYRLSRYVFGDGWLFLLAVAVLSLNPFVLDQLSVARGYGMAAAFCLWAFYHLLRYLSETPARASSLLKAAFGLALSVAANLTFLFIDTALAVLLLLILLVDAARAGSLAREAFFAARCFVIPGMVTAVSIMIVPLSKAQRDNFYVGAKTLAASVQSLVDISLFHHPDVWGMDRYYAYLMMCTAAVGKKIAPAVLALATVAGLWIAYRWIRAKSFRSLDRSEQFLFLSAGALLAAVGASVAAHRALDLLYPVTRTGLSWILFFVLISLGLLKHSEKLRLAGWLVRAPLALFLWACVIWFGFEFNTRFYAEWRYDAGTKRIVALLRDRHVAEGREKTRVGVTWMLEQSMNFYKRLYRLNWLEVIDIRQQQRGLDYIVLADEDLPLVEKLHLRPLYTDPVSGQVLAPGAT